MPKALLMERCNKEAAKEVHYYQWKFQRPFPFLKRQLVWSYLCIDCYKEERDTMKFMGLADADEDDRCDVRWLAKGGPNG